MNPQWAFPVLNLLSLALLRIWPGLITAANQSFPFYYPQSETIWNENTLCDQSQTTSIRFVGKYFFKVKDQHFITTIYWRGKTAAAFHPAWVQKWNIIMEKQCKTAQTHWRSPLYSTSTIQLYVRNDPEIPGVCLEKNITAFSNLKTVSFPVFVVHSQQQVPNVSGNFILLAPNKAQRWINTDINERFCLIVPVGHTHTHTHSGAGFSYAVAAGTGGVSAAVRGRCRVRLSRWRLLQVAKQDSRRLWVASAPRWVTK